MAEGEGKGRRLPESVANNLLGDWTTRQWEEIQRGEGGRDDHPTAALTLQERLEKIVVGEPPFDMFVFLKAMDEQPVGREPDVNDGVRLKIRPFVAEDTPGGK